jgi:hypothetical protein
LAGVALCWLVSPGVAQCRLVTLGCDYFGFLVVVFVLVLVVAALPSPPLVLLFLWFWRVGWSVGHPDNFGKAKFWTAEAVVTNSGRWLYCVCRVHHSIAIFAVDQDDGSLAQAGRVALVSEPFVLFLAPNSSLFTDLRSLFIFSCWILALLFRSRATVGSTLHLLRHSGHLKHEPRWDHARRR